MSAQLSLLAEEFTRQERPVRERLAAPAFVLAGDCLDVLRTFPNASISAVVTDPPYGLSKEPDMIEVLRHWLAEGETYRHKGSGFMGKSWDSFVPAPEVWREVLRVLKPGGHALVFSGTRTYDLTVLAMRIAGFEIRDQLAWLYGSGFPKSLDIGKAMDKNAGLLGTQHRAFVVAGGGDRSLGDPAKEFRSDYGYVHEYKSDEAQRWSGWGTALKPAQEPIVLARKPLIGTVAANVLAHGTGGINVDVCRIGSEGGCRGATKGDTPGTALAGSVDGSLNGSFALPVPGLGRWPANVILDEVAAKILDEQSGTLAKRGHAGPSKTDTDPVSCYGKFGASDCGDQFNYDKGGGASRFFYVAKTSRAEREAGLDHLPKHSAGELTDREDGSDGIKSPRAGAGRTSAGRANTHPTVKPIALMRHLVRMITPPGGMVLDPYGGSGSTACAAVLEGFASTTVELTPEYIPLIEGRIEHCRDNAPDYEIEQ